MQCSKCNEESIILSGPDQGREILSEQESTDTLEWDPEPDCTELHDELNEAFLTAHLDLGFKSNSTDFMAVYDFTDVLPLESEGKAKKKSEKKTFKYLKKLVKRKGDTLSKRH